MVIWLNTTIHLYNIDRYVLRASVDKYVMQVR